MLRRAIIRLFVLLLWSAPALALTGPQIESRVEDLLRRMTLEEKVGQLNLVSNETDFDDAVLRAGRVSAVINFNNARDIARAQRAARQSRLGIPLLFGLDILHGFRTSFPVPLAETATFNPRLARMAAEWSAREASYIGLQWTYAPMADVSRDPRWGRIAEGSGEDPYLGRVFAAARVEGLRAGGLAAGVKHFAGYGAAAGGRDYDSTDIPPVELRDTFLPPFKAAIEAGAETVMSAFNSLNGVPATANPWLLTGVLRQEWGFKGFVVSDWAAIHELIAHGVAADGAEAARKALLAGVDMDLGAGFYDRHLADEVRAERVPIAAVDEAVRRVLRVKFGMGLFERPDTDPARVDAVFPTPESRRAAREVAREAIVLLQNRGDVLPLRENTRSIALIGSLAANGRDQLGPHAARGHVEDTVTILDGLRRRASASGVAVAYAPGCDAHCSNQDGFGEAVAAARAADVVVAVVGEAEEISGEAASRAHLSLPGHQRALVEALAATGKPVVLVLGGGRPFELGAVLDKTPAALVAWFLGNEGGPAVAETLFGDVNPSGKLPVTFPRAVGQIPMNYNRLPSGRPTNPQNRFTLGYMDESVLPLFPFGWGLSYTRFRFSDLTVATPRLTAADTVEVRVRVTNDGPRAGQEVAQLYLRDPVASRSRPVRELKGFEKIALAPGESRLVTFRVPGRDLGFHHDDGTFVVEPGQFQVFVGPNSAADLAGRFEIVEGLREPPGAARP